MITRSVWRLAEGEQRVFSSVHDLQQRLESLRNSGGLSTHHFFNPIYEEAIHDPFEMSGMEDAVQRIFRAIKKGEKILVWGDYDADGITATAVMVDVLQQLGAYVTPYLPHRGDEGYGLSRETLESLIEGIDLLISVDCGVSNGSEIEWLQSCNVDVIVVDHHEIPEELPPAFALLHPRHPEGHYPFPDLAGSAVAWKLAQGLLRTEHGGISDEEKWLLDLPTIGTIGDVMPLLGENRAIVAFGLQIIERSRRPGLVALLQLRGLDQRSVTAEDMGYRVVPLLNAAGRMDHPQAALDVLLAPSSTAAETKVKALAKLNNERRVLTNIMLEEAQGLIDETLPAIFVFNPDWSPGVVGVVAGRLASQYQKPAIVVGGGNGKAVGSARTAGDVDIHAALQSAAQYAITLGGHKQAAGFSLSVKDVEKFQSAVIKSITASSNKRQTAREFSADAIITPELVDWPTHQMIRKFEPFGEGNMEPTFILRDMPVVDARAVGRDNSHIKLRLAAQGKDLEAIGFGLGDRLNSLQKSIDVLGSIAVNSFRGRQQLQIKLDDIADAGVAVVK